MTRFRLIAFVFCLLIPTVAQAEPTLSFVERRGDSYRWAYRGADGQESELYRGPLRPTHFFWSADGHTVLFLAGSELKRAALGGNGAEITSLGAVPDRFGDIEALWVDRRTSRVRVAAMAPIAAKDVLRVGGRVEYRSGDGQRVLGLLRPSWGLPFIVTVLEQDADRRWRTLVRKGTKAAAGDTPGLSVIDAEVSPAGTTIKALLAAYTCENGRCRADVTPAVASAVSRAAGRTIDADDLSLWRPSGSANTIVFRTVMGDVAHMTTPVLLLRAGDLAPQPVVSGYGRQVGLAPEGSLLLVADEFTGANPALVELGTGNSVWSSDAAIDAVWAPKLP